MDEYLDSFSHGPIVSKLWLCEELENILMSLDYSKPTVNILGGWINVLGFMMQIRKPNYYNEITSYDADSESTRMSDKLCEAWKFEESKIYNKTRDVRRLTFDKNIPELVFINCSVDQFEGQLWYDNIPSNSVVCLQTTTLPIKNAPWKITQETRDITELLDKYKFNKVLFTGEKRIQYENFGYTRLMSIGIK